MANTKHALSISLQLADTQEINLEVSLYDPCKKIMYFGDLREKNIRGEKGWRLFYLYVTPELDEEYCIEEINAIESQSKPSRVNICAILIGTEKRKEINKKVYNALGLCLERG